RSCPCRRARAPSCREARIEDGGSMNKNEGGGWRMKDGFRHPQSSIFNSRLVLIAGPTAVGKSQIALLLAERLGGEVISADSMQVYRGLDIGTAKPSPAERARVPHHLI